MGFSTTSLHIRARDHERASICASLIAHIHQQARAAGYHAYDDPTAPADREILLVPHPGPWIAVYDTAFDGADADTLAHLAAGCSQAANTTALVLQVVDSDAVAMRRFHAGAHHDSFVSDPSYLGLDDDGTLAGDPGLWQDVLAPGYTPADVRAVWDARRIFAEQTLRDAAPLLGLDPNLALSTAEQAIAAARDDTEALLQAVTHLRFSLRSLPPALQFMHGPPRFVSAGGADLIDLRVGATMPPAGVTCFSQGGAATGVMITCAGIAVERQLLDLTGLRLVYGQEKGEAEGLTTSIPVPLERITGATGSVYQAILPAVPIAGGVADPMALYTGAAQVNPRRVAHVLQMTQLMLVFHGVARVAGTGSLMIRVAPLANPTDGAATWSIRVRIHQ